MAVTAYPYRCLDIARVGRGVSHPVSEVRFDEVVGADGVPRNRDALFSTWQYPSPFESCTEAQVLWKQSQQGGTTHGRARVHWPQRLFHVAWVRWTTQMIYRFPQLICRNVGRGRNTKLSIRVFIISRTLRRYYPFSVINSAPSTRHISLERPGILDILHNGRHKHYRALQTEIPSPG